MLRSMILGFVVTLSPLLLGAQGLSPAAVIPTQALIPRGSVFLRGAAMTDAPAAKAVPVCSMPVATVDPDASRAAHEGGIAPPSNRGVPILTARSACTNSLDSRASDHAPPRSH